MAPSGGMYLGPGGRRAKIHVEADQRAMCKLCQLPDTEEHWLVACKSCSKYFCFFPLHTSNSPNTLMTLTHGTAPEDAPDEREYAPCCFNSTNHNCDKKELLYTASMFACGVGHDHMVEWTGHTRGPPSLAKAEEYFNMYTEVYQETADRWSQVVTNHVLDSLIDGTCLRAKPNEVPAPAMATADQVQAVLNQVQAVLKRVEQLDEKVQRLESEDTLLLLCKQPVRLVSPEYNQCLCTQPKHPQLGGAPGEQMHHTPVTCAGSDLSLPGQVFTILPHKNEHGQLVFCLQSSDGRFMRWPDPEHDDTDDMKLVPEALPQCEMQMEICDDNMFAFKQASGEHMRFVHTPSSRGMGRTEIRVRQTGRRFASVSVEPVSVPPPLSSMMSFPVDNQSATAKITICDLGQGSPIAGDQLAPRKSYGFGILET